MSELFLCRKCSNVAYGSQQESVLDRLSRKTRKIRHRLDDGSGSFDPDNLSDWISSKPLNMHWSTFDRLKQKESSLQEAMDNAFQVKYGHWM